MENNFADRRDVAGIAVVMAIVGVSLYIGYYIGSQKYFEPMQTARRELVGVRQELHDLKIERDTTPPPRSPLVQNRTIQFGSNVPLLFQTVDTGDESLVKRLVNQDGISLQEASVIQDRELWMKIGRKEFMSLLYVHNFLKEGNQAMARELPWNVCSSRSIDDSMWLVSVPFCLECLAKLRAAGHSEELLSPFLPKEAPGTEP